MEQSLCTLLHVSEFLKELDALSLFRLLQVSRCLQKESETMKWEWKSVCVAEFGSEDMLETVKQTILSVEGISCHGDESWALVGRYLACTKALFGDHFYFSHKQWNSSIRF